VTVPAATSAAAVEAALRAGAGDLLESIRLFDVYSDDRLRNEGRKSLAFALRFRADRTLTVEEASAARDAAVASAAAQLDAELRA
jgi:phenylalanyl-tRNA synthetase beta chain